MTTVINYVHLLLNTLFHKYNGSRYTTKCNFKGEHTGFERAPDVKTRAGGAPFETIKMLEKNQIASVSF